MGDLPKTIGPYAPYRKSKNFIFTSGQLPLSPETNQIDTDTIEEQTIQILKNLQAIAECERIQLDNIVKTTVYLKNIADFTSFNETYAKFFNAPYPARTAIEVGNIPLNALIEIEAVFEL